MRVIRIGVTALATVALVYVGGWPNGPLPALGPVLDPVHGVWSVATSTNPPRDDRFIVNGLQSSVEIEYDDRGVPHIFATSTDDAVWALGYVVARDRLFQLELQTRATAGTLTEVLGPDALDADRFQRQLGLAWSADREWAELDHGSAAARLVTAYSRGVNAWIDKLAPSQLPFEYHLLGSSRNRGSRCIRFTSRAGWGTPFPIARSSFGAMTSSNASAPWPPMRSFP